MKFKVGDQVKFLNDSGGGIIAEIVNHNLVKVRIEDGFEIPVLASELILDVSMDMNIRESTGGHPGQRKLAKKIVDADIESILPENLPGDVFKNVLLGFVPIDQNNTSMSNIEMYLVNDDDYAIAYNIGFQESISWRFLKTGYLEPNTKLSIETFNQSQISKIKAMHIQLLFIAKGKYNLQSPVEKFIGLDNIRFYKENTFKENSYFHEKALLLKISDEIDEAFNHLTGDEITKAMKEKESDEQQKPIIHARVNETEEVDLHIHEIVDDYSRLSPGEILEVQMNRFYIALEGGLINKLKKIIFIHGIGNGKLKYEIIKALNEKYPDLTYQDASFKEYGYGATMVYLTRTTKKN